MSPASFSSRTVAGSLAGAHCRVAVWSRPGHHPLWCCHPHLLERHGEQAMGNGSTSSVRPPSDSEAAILKRVVLEAESYLDAQLKVALAADQRALVFAGFLAAATVALIGYGASSIFNGGAGAAIGHVAMGVGSVMLIAVFLAVLAARPVEFWLVGNSPKVWEEDIKCGRALADCWQEIATDLERRINCNMRTIRTNGRLLGASIWIAFCALIFGAIGIWSVLP